MKINVDAAVKMMANAGAVNVVCRSLSGLALDLTRVRIASEFLDSRDHHKSQAYTYGAYGKVKQRSCEN
jgi:hypothetical protein